VLWGHIHGVRGERRPALLDVRFLGKSSASLMYMVCWEFLDGFAEGDLLEYFVGGDESQMPDRNQT
jgi:hypothetical protein